MKNCALVSFLPLLVFLFTSGCSLQGGSGIAVTKDAAAIQNLDSRIQAPYAGPGSKNNPMESRARTDTAEITGTVAIAPAPDPTPREAEKPFAGKNKITLHVQFDTNEDIIKDAYCDELAGFARVMKNHPHLKVTIEGHTDNVGNADSNLSLSRKRAESVKNYLVSDGIDASRIAAQGYGQSRPIADNGTEEGKQKNRRVEAALEYEKAAFLKKKTLSEPPAFP